MVYLSLSNAQVVSSHNDDVDVLKLVVVWNKFFICLLYILSILLFYAKVLKSFEIKKYFSYFSLVVSFYYSLLI
jgi:hypothetical protein